jgi:hypothetical protein
VLLAIGVAAGSDVAVAVISPAGTVAVASPAVGDAVRVAVFGAGVGLSVGAGVVGRGTCVVAGGGVVGDTNGVVAAAVGDPAAVTCKVTVLVSTPPAYSARRVKVWVWLGQTWRCSSGWTIALSRKIAVHGPVTRQLTIVHWPAANVVGLAVNCTCTTPGVKVGVGVCVRVGVTDGVPDVVGVGVSVVVGVGVRVGVGVSAMLHSWSNV